MRIKIAIRRPKSQSLTSNLISFMPDLTSTQESRAHAILGYFYYQYTNLWYKNRWSIRLVHNVMSVMKPFKSAKVQSTLSFSIANQSTDRLRFYVKWAVPENRIAIIQIEWKFHIMHFKIELPNFQTESLVRWNRHLNRIAIGLCQPLGGGCGEANVSATARALSWLPPTQRKAMPAVL